MATLLETISAEVLNLDLSKLVAPSLDGLTATRPRPEVTKAELHRRLRAIAPKRDRAPGETVGRDDQVLVNHLAYAGGKLVPRCIRFDIWLDDVHPLLIGLRERLTGTQVGTGVEVGVVLPERFPPEWKGKPALFRVDVLAAREVLVPPIDEPGQMKKLGRGKTIDEVMSSLAAEALRDAQQLAELDVQNQVLDQLAARLSLQLTDAQLDHEIRRRWAESEGQALAAKSFDAAEQKDALEVFRSDPDVRHEAERSLKVTVALGLVRQRDKVSLTKEGVTALIEASCAMSGMKPDEHRELLRTDAGLAYRFQTLALHVATIDHVMAKATVTDAPPPEEED